MQITVGHLNPTDSPYQRGAKVFKKVLEKATGGQITVRIIPNLSLSGAQLIQAVRKGKLDIGITASGPIGELVPVTNALDFPYLFRSRQHAYRVLDGEIGNFMNRRIEKIGLKNLAWWENGFRHITTANKPIRKPGDLNGLPFRTLDNQVYRTLFGKVWGTRLTSIPISQLYQALKKGTVQGEENPLGILVSNRFYEVQKHLSLTGHMYSPALFVMNKAKFDSFPITIRRKIVHAAKVSRNFERNYLKKNDPLYLRIARRKGMRVLTKKQINYCSFVRTSRKVYALLGKPYASILRRIRGT
jgi:tripartite ATP-independent transporter DctP family solute receptor